MKSPDSNHMNFRAWLAMGCLAFVLSACGGEPGVSSETSTPTAPPVKSSPAGTPAASATPLLPYRFPLTGLPSAIEITSRPYLVMVENSPQARPQTGLDQADLVYEILAEGEVTRFVSVFQSQEAEVIGPVRSIRPYFVELGDMLDAIIVHAGWSQDAMNILTTRRLAHLDQVYGDHAYYWRATDRKAPHNLYTSVEKMSQGAADRKFREEWKQPVVTFAANGQSRLTGAAVSYIEIPYISGYVVSYEYDAQEGIYKRNMLGKPHLDKESGNQLQTKNLLVLESKHRILDNEGRRSVDVIGPGTGMILQQGKSQNITWQRKDGMLRVYDGDNELPLLPGNTWVQIVPVGTELKLE